MVATEGSYRNIESSSFYSAWDLFLQGPKRLPLQEQFNETTSPFVNRCSKALLLHLLGRIFALLKIKVPFKSHFFKYSEYSETNIPAFFCFCPLPQSRNVNSAMTSQLFPPTQGFRLSLTVTYVHYLPRAWKSG